MTTDKEARDFLESDLSGLDFSQFKPVRFELKPKDKALSLRLPESLLAAIRKEARREGIPYQRFIRAAIEKALPADAHQRAR